MSLIDKLKAEHRALDPDLKRTLDAVIKKLETWQLRDTQEKNYTVRETAVQNVCKMLADYRDHIIERKIIEYLAKSDVAYNAASTLALNLGLWGKEVDQFALQYKFSPVYTELVTRIFESASRGIAKPLLDKLIARPEPGKPSIRELIEKAAAHFKTGTEIWKHLFDYVEQVDPNSMEANALYALANAKNPHPAEAIYLITRKWVNYCYSFTLTGDIDDIIGRISRITQPPEEGQKITPAEKELERFKKQILKAQGKEKEVGLICQRTAYRLKEQYGIDH